MAIRQHPTGKGGRRRGGFILSLLALAGAGGLSWLTAATVAEHFEGRLTGNARLALQAQGLDWVHLHGDGTLVHLSGTAPDEIARFRALRAVQEAIVPGRAIDAMQVAPQAAHEAPEFQIDLLYHPGGVSVIGLVPAATDRPALLSSLAGDEEAQEVFDALEVADYPVPLGWDAALDFGLEAGRLTKSAKISIRAGHVTVEAITDSEAERARLEQALQAARPEMVELTAAITAPRPLISPFRLEFVLDGEGARLEACAADTEQARDRILAAARRAGAGSPNADAGGDRDGDGPVRDVLSCPLGLGTPSPGWGEVAERAIDALARIGAGALTISDRDITLRAPADAGEAAFDEAVARLQAGLPTVFRLDARQDHAAAEGPDELTARLDSSGQVVLRGRITDMPMRDAVESFARSRFGQSDSELQIDPELPAGWSLRVIAALDVMSQLHDGAARVTPDLIRISGISGDQDAPELIARQLADRLGAGVNYQLAIRYDRWLDSVLALPSGAECVDDLNTVMTESEIGFEPGRSVIAGDPGPTLELLADVMQNCRDFRIELGGHTDSQGSEGLNAELSRSRAQAVLAAMGETGIDIRHMTARGYGESQPIADNDTEAGREANRRIEFRLLTPQPVDTAPQPQVRTVTGVTETPPLGALSGPNLPDIIPIPSPGPDDPDLSAGEQAGFDTDPQPYATMVATILVHELLLIGSDHEHLHDESDLGAEASGAWELPAPVDAATALVREIISDGGADAVQNALTRGAATTALQAIGGAGVAAALSGAESQEP